MSIATFVIGVGVGLLAAVIIIKIAESRWG